MEVKLFQYIVNEVGQIIAAADPVEGIVCGVHRKRRYIETLTAWGSSGDAGRDANIDRLRSSTTT